jgi:hypothetical protein
VEFLQSEDRNKKLKAENDDLINRWVKYKNQEAEKMNQTTELEAQLAEAWRFTQFTLTIEEKSKN